MCKENSKRLVQSLVAAAVLSLGLAATAEAAKPPQTTEDGLELTKSKKVAVLYTRPGTFAYQGDARPGRSPSVRINLKDTDLADWA